jgi:maltooligosyltrehalose trehalohydrolase
MEALERPALLELYRYLIQLRKTHPALLNRDRQSVKAWSDKSKQLLTLYRGSEDSQLLSVMNFSDRVTQFQPTLSVNTEWHKQFDSADEKWLGPGVQMPQRLTAAQAVTISPKSAVIYELISP